MLHTPVMRFEPSRRVGADRMIRHHERHQWQPISASRNDARRGVWALRHCRRLQRSSGTPLTPSREAGCGSPRPERSRAPRNGRCVPGGQEGVSGQPLGTHRATVAAQASDRPLQGWGGLVPACHRGHCWEQLGGPLGSSRGVYTGGGAGLARQGPVLFPMPLDVRVE